MNEPQTLWSEDESRKTEHPWGYCREVWMVFCGKCEEICEVAYPTLINNSTCKSILDLNLCIRSFTEFIIIIYSHCCHHYETFTFVPLWATFHSPPLPKPIHHEFVSGLCLLCQYYSLCRQHAIMVGAWWRRMGLRIPVMIREVLYLPLRGVGIVE